MKICVGIVDDHQLFLKSLSLMLSGFENFTVAVESLNGKDLQDKMKLIHSTPDIILVDVSMPVMDGVECTGIIKQQYPDIKILILTTFDDDEFIIEALKIRRNIFYIKCSI